jgi:hypothetical protein
MQAQLLQLYSQYSCIILVRGTLGYYFEQVLYPYTQEKMTDF